MKKIYTPIVILAILFAASITSCSKSNDAPLEGKATVQFVNASQAGSINFYADGNMVYENLGYPSQSSTTNIMSAGDHSFSVSAWRSTAIIGSGNYTLSGNNFYSVFLIDSLTHPKIVPIVSDPNASPIDNDGKLRIFNFSPNSPSVDIKVTNQSFITVSDFILRNRTFNDQGADAEKLSFKDMVAGPYRIEVYTAGTNNLLFSHDITIIKARNYTLYLAGSFGTSNLILGSVTHN